ncbi:MAG: N-acetyltransferase [Meiothermus sp.]
MTAHIRAATLADTHAIAELLCNVDDYPQWKRRGVDALEPLVRKSLERNHLERSVLVAELDSRVVGYAAVYWVNYLFNSPEGYVTELFVRTDASGRGVGTALLEAVEQEARVRACRRLTLINLKDRESYKRGFYAARGWTEDPNAMRFVKSLE